MAEKKISETFELAGLTWKVLDITEQGVMCLADFIGEDMKFDTSCNDWKVSKLRKYLNTEFYQKLVSAVGEENIIEFERNLLSLDGQTEYGTCMDKVSMINVDEYRKYRSLIPNTGDWWWTITPDSTKCNNDSRWLAVVSPSGSFFNYFYYYVNGVRPFCIFSSSIFESEEE